MIDGVRALGGEVRLEDGALIVTPAPPPGKPVTDAPAAECHVHACAAALRMLIPAFLTRGQAVRFLMEPALFRRPLDAFEPLVRQAGGRMTRTPAGPDGLAVVEVSGFLPAGRYEVDGSRSSQFASGLLIALAHAITPDGTPAPAALTVTGPIVSRPYLDMTLRLTGALRDFLHGAGGRRIWPLARLRAPRRKASLYRATGPRRRCFCAWTPWAAAVMLPNLRRDGLQGDARIVDVLEEMGLRIRQTPRRVVCRQPSHAGLMPARIDCSDIPDLAPILALTCTQARGVSTLTGVSRLRLKECDRLLATQELLARLGAKTDVSPDGDTLTVTGSPCACAAASPPMHAGTTAW